LWRSLVCALVAVAAAMVGRGGWGQALPPARSDVLPVVAVADVAARLGQERITLTGWMQLDRTSPRPEGGVEVVDLEIVGMRLRGASQLGAISAVQRSAAVSRGELRSLERGSQFPASSFIDLFADVSAPDSPFGPLSLHNEVALHLASAAPLDAWPPLGVRYQLEPVFTVDNDGDGSTDEDTADEDGDLLIDEDRPGPDPATPGFEPECGDDADCDGLEGEDPPLELCAPAVCDSDGDGRSDEDPSCIPLLTETNTHLKLGLCVRDLSLEIAPELPSYSSKRGGPSQLHPADVLALTPRPGASGSQAPFVRMPCISLGLTADGCDDGADGDQDDLDALSYGDELSPSGEPRLYFSVGPGAQGVAGSAVEEQRNCPPAQPGASPEPESDEFGSALHGTNTHVLDGNGPVGSCSPAFPLGLVESLAARDDLDALDGRDSSAVDADADGAPERPVYFSLDGLSPSLAAFGFSPADVLKTVGGGAPAPYASAAELGLAAGDDIDALCLRESGDGVYGPGDVVYYSLTPRSPSLSSLDAGPGDVLAPGWRPVIVAGSSLGLIAGDDVDALKCPVLPASPAADGDVNCDEMVNSIDAALVLQLEAGLVAALPCAVAADVSQDGVVNSIDAALILQREAGLVGGLAYNGNMLDAGWHTGTAREEVAP
jgi:hypothetical protein